MESQNSFSIVGGELEDLRIFLSQTEGLSDFLTDWSSNLLDATPSLEQEDLVRDVQRDYERFDVNETGGNRSYRVDLRVDREFGKTIIDQIHGFTSLMLKRMAEGQVQNFIAIGTRVGNLTARRNRTYPFPYPLPYLNPSPTNLEGRIREEAAVVEYAVHAALSGSARILYINSFSSPSNNGYWTLGSAPVNSFNSDRHLWQRLNKLAFPHFDDNTWIATIAHEILHNLGWGHGDGDYKDSNAIEIYEECIRTSKALQEKHYIN